MITYCVSGDEDIEPVGDNLKASGRDVLHGEAVNTDAVVALSQGGKYVVVAHGDTGGTVFLRRGVAEQQLPWVWVGMDPAPSTARVYFYCCNAGPNITQFLRQCDCLGHGDVVPMPVDEDLDNVVSFLDEVDSVLQDEQFDASQSSERLRRFVARKLDSALVLVGQGSYRPVVIWSMLARSLN